MNRAVASEINLDFLIHLRKCRFFREGPVMENAEWLRGFVNFGHLDVEN